MTNALRVQGAHVVRLCLPQLVSARADCASRESEEEPTKTADQSIARRAISMCAHWSVYASSEKAKSEPSMLK